jgi:hypothetical protein
VADDALTQTAPAVPGVEATSVVPAVVPAPVTAPEPQAKKRPTLYERRRAAIQRRFAGAYFALAVVVGVAVGLAIVLVSRSGGTHAAWSSFKPTAHGLEAAQQIAGHVSAGYRLNGKPLASALASAPEVQQSVTISAVAIRSGFADERPQDVTFVNTNHAVVYLFTGTGSKGAIPGSATAKRGNVLRREILETSLYTFKYVDGIDTVIAFPPPTFDSSGNVVPRAVVLQKKDYGKLLGRPLTETLPARPRETPSVQLTPKELGSIAKVRFMQFDFQALPNDTALLVLTPVAG